MTYAWRLDGLLDARSWPTGSNSGSLAYDGAKRPTTLTETAGAATLATFGRTYDPNGTVTSETQTISGVAGDAGGGTQTFTVDPLRRVTATSFGLSGTTKSYGYDANSNRTSQTEGGVTSSTVVDRTGVPRTLTVSGSVANYVSDAYGNLLTSVVPTPVAADSVAPSTPTNLVATANGRTRADLSWSAASDNVGVTAYDVYRGGVLVMKVAGTVTSWSDYSLSPGTTYSYTIKARDAAGNTSGTSTASQTTTQSGNGGNDSQAPSVPTGLAATAVTSKQINLSWTASTDNTGVQGYRVYRDGVLAATVGTPSFFDTGLTAGSAHTYRVAAIDGKGNASAQSSQASGTALASVRTTTYAYDLADRLVAITPQAGSGSPATLTLDALGRHRTRVSGGITETYSYAGESPAIVSITPSSGTAVRSVVDPTGARLAVTTSAGGFGWTLADLHGDIAGYVSQAGGLVTEAVRYDPWGETVAGGAGSLARPWGYQGRLDLAASADTDLLDFGFRPYVPDLGLFTSPDDQAGQALNPLTFNRYLYAGASPATMVDPDGHCFRYIDGLCADKRTTQAQQRAVAAKHRALMRSRAEGVERRYLQRRGSLPPVATPELHAAGNGVLVATSMTALVYDTGWDVARGLRQRASGLGSCLARCTEAGARSAAAKALRGAGSSTRFAATSTFRAVGRVLPVVAIGTDVAVNLSEGQSPDEAFGRASLAAGLGAVGAQSGVTLCGILAVSTGGAGCIALVVGLGFAGGLLGSDIGDEIYKDTPVLTGRSLREPPRDHPFLYPLDR